MPISSCLPHIFLPALLGLPRVYMYEIRRTLFTKVGLTKGRLGRVVVGGALLTQPTRNCCGCVVCQLKSRRVWVRILLGAWSQVSRSTQPELCAFCLPSTQKVCCSDQISSGIQSESLDFTDIHLCLTCILSLVFMTTSLPDQAPTALTLAKPFGSPFSGVGVSLPAKTLPP